ncbi:hypothetical protein GCM10010493_82250 [Streptomyces lavendulae subsp. grasserius]
MPVGFSLLSVVGDSRLEPLVLSETEQQVLSNWVKRRTTAQGLALRARIVLAGAEALQLDQDRRPDPRPHLPLLLTHLRTSSLGTEESFIPVSFSSFSSR